MGRHVTGPRGWRWPTDSCALSSGSSLSARWRPPVSPAPRPLSPPPGRSSELGVGCGGGCAEGCGIQYPQPLSPHHLLQEEAVSWGAQPLSPHHLFHEVWGSAGIDTQLRYILTGIHGISTDDNPSMHKKKKPPPKVQTCTALTHALYLCEHVVGVVKTMQVPLRQRGDSLYFQCPFCLHAGLLVPPYWRGHVVCSPLWPPSPYTS